jgi:hypothetical protein
VLKPLFEGLDCPSRIRLYPTEEVVRCFDSLSPSHLAPTTRSLLASFPAQPLPCSEL